MREHDPSRRPFWHLRRRPARVVSDVDEELRVHLEMRAEELRAGGMAPEAAQREALRRFGDLEGTRRYCRQQSIGKENRVQRSLMFGDLMADVRISLRGLLRARLLTLAIVATVGVGIGATTVIFSGINAALLRPLPYPAAERLVWIYTDAPPDKFRFSLADYLALQQQQTHFDQIAAYTDLAMAFSDGVTAERLRGRVASWTYLPLLGIRPVMGRPFTAADDRPGSPPAAIVSHGFWQRRLGGRASIVGTTVRLDGEDHLVIGVMPARVGPLEQRVDVFVAGRWEPPPRKGPFFMTVLGRLRTQSGHAAAAAELRGINRRIFPLWRASYQDSKATWALADLKTRVVGDVRLMAGLALGAVGLVWLLACTNASNLLIARVTGRRRELAVRVAVGASRPRIVRYLLVESGLLAAGAAAVGIALAWGGVNLLRNFGVGYFPRVEEITLDGTVLWLLIGLTAASGLLFGLIPALHGTGGPVDDSLRTLGRSTTGNRGVRRLRRLLVGGQFAIATPLLVVAGLLLASLNELKRVDVGFDTHNLLTGAILLPAAQYGEPGPVAAFWDELRRQVAVVPGVTGVAFADGRPPDDVGNINNFNLEEAPISAGQAEPVAPWVAVSPEYFGVLGLALLEGRVLTDRDGVADGPSVVVVDRAWARRFFPDGSAVGKRLRGGGCTACPWTTVVGVVSDVKYEGLDRPDEGTVYTPIAERPLTFPIETGTARFRYLVVRTGAAPSTVLPSVRHVIRTLDPELPFSSVATIDELIAESLQRPRSLSLLVGAFALTALALSLFGIYGMMAYYVQQHLKEISIRLALGGTSGAVLRLIVGHGMRVVVSGVVMGLLTAVMLTRLVAGLLFGVAAIDPFTFAAVAVLLLAVALVACLVPASRAVHLEPAAILRNE
jgi:putative ABC transport system permease protein